jgi:hypothetical protein
MQNLIKVVRRFFLVLVCLIPLFAFGQDEPKLTKKQQKAHAKKEQRAQDAKKAEIAGKKRHMKLQDKKTRKRMKKNKKHGGSYVSRNPGFFNRLMKPFR